MLSDPICIEVQMILLSLFCSLVLLSSRTPCQPWSAVCCQLRVSSAHRDKLLIACHHYHHVAINNWCWKKFKGENGELNSLTNIPILILTTLIYPTNTLHSNHLIDKKWEVAAHKTESMHSYLLLQILRTNMSLTKMYLLTDLYSGAIALFFNQGDQSLKGVPSAVGFPHCAGSVTNLCTN